MRALKPGRSEPRRPCRGFAILLSLLLVLILTIFGYWILLLAEKHYAATKMLYDSENARIISEAAATRFVLEHNSGLPRFFTNPAGWDGLRLKPFVWNDYQISGELLGAWNPEDVNLFHLQAQRARSYAKLQVPLRQIRFEDFAFFSNLQQSLSSSSVFDGNVFVRSGLTVQRPVRFREKVHNEVSPAYYASYRIQTRLWLDFPPLTNESSLSGGLNITGQDPRFWEKDHYELDLDQLKLSQNSGQWQVSYKGVTIGQTSTLVLLFDRHVHVSQKYSERPHLSSGKQAASLYLVSEEEVVIQGSVQTLQGNLYEHPLCFYSRGSIRILSDLSAIRLEACFISAGDPSVEIQAGASPLSAADQQSWIAEIQGSAFLVEPEKKAELLEALNTNQKIVWFRGSVGVNGAFSSAPDVSQIHFEGCRKIHALIPSFPFVQIVEARQKWL